VDAEALRLNGGRFPAANTAAKLDAAADCSDDGVEPMPSVSRRSVSLAPGGEWAGPARKSEAGSLAGRLRFPADALPSWRLPADAWLFSTVLVAAAPPSTMR
jgi:hypothetical protein